MVCRIKLKPNMYWFIAWRLSFTFIDFLTQAAELEKEVLLLFTVLFILTLVTILAWSFAPDKNKRFEITRSLNTRQVAKFRQQLAQQKEVDVPRNSLYNPFFYLLLSIKPLNCQNIVQGSLEPVLLNL
jgi:hypothetical protein